MVIIFSCKNNVITQNKLPYFIAYEAHVFNESLLDSSKSVVILGWVLFIRLYR